MWIKRWVSIPWKQFSSMMEIYPLQIQVSIEKLRNLKIDESVSFDSDFDKVDGIIRIS